MLCVVLNKQDKERYAREMENYTPPVDTTSGKRRRDPNQPKRPMTAYFHFMQERRPIIQEQFPDMKLMDISKLLSEEWRNMSGEARAKYNELYQQDKERYAREMAEYNASSTSHNDVHDVGVVPGGWPWVRGYKQSGFRFCFLYFIEFIILHLNAVL